MNSDGKYSDKKLIEDLKTSPGGGGNADLKAFERLFHRYYPMLLNFLAGFVKSRPEAEDIAQNCFMKLWINRFSLSPDQSVKNYLFVLARNEAINVLSSRRSKNIPITAQYESVPHLDILDHWLTFTETNILLRKNIDALPPQRQIIFKMSRYGHMSNMEIAVNLNLSVRTVEKHIELALKDLRKCLDQHKIN